MPKYILNIYYSLENKMSKRKLAAWMNEWMNKYMYVCVCIYI